MMQPRLPGNQPMRLPAQVRQEYEQQMLHRIRMQTQQQPTPQPAPAAGAAATAVVGPTPAAATPPQTPLTPTATAAPSTPKIIVQGVSPYLYLSFPADYSALLIYCF